MTLADRIREAMGTGMKPADLAREAGVTQAAVSQWLDGTTKSLKAEKAARIEAATGYRANWIVTGKGPKKVSEAESAPEDQQLLDEYRQVLLDLNDIPPPRRDRLIEAIRAAAAETREAVAHFDARKREKGARSGDVSLTRSEEERATRLLEQDDFGEVGIPKRHEAE